LFLLAATALHAGVLLVAYAMPPLALKPSALRDLQPIDIDLQQALVEEVRQMPAPVPEDVEPTQRPPDERTPETHIANRTAPTPNGPRPTTTAEPAAENPAPAPTARKPDWDELPAERRGVLGVPGVPGLSGPGVWALPGVLPSGTPAAAPAPTVAPAPRPVDPDIAGKVVRDVMSKKDKKLGLDSPAAGTVAASVATAIRGSDVPNVARGTIEFRIGPNGQVLGVKVISMSGGTADQWQRAAQAAAAAVAGRLVMTGEYAKGMTVSVDVTSNVAPPAGSNGGFTGSGANFDLSNIGAHATRNVRSSFRVMAAR
jgi:hypothetical protein